MIDLLAFVVTEVILVQDLLQIPQLLLARFKFRALPVVRWWWILVAIFAGMAWAILWNTVNGYSEAFHLKSLIFPPLYFLAYAGVTEEPLFRGFLWGLLRRAGWRDVWAWLLQTGLFALAHIYYLRQTPLAFWVIVPSGALLLGLLAWRSRSIATSLVAHGFCNGIGIGF